MNKAILCIGINEFNSADITPLRGAADDAREWARFFGRQLGFTTELLTHEDLRHGAAVWGALDRLLNHVSEPGDQLGIFIATHGLLVDAAGTNDQVYLLPHARLDSLYVGKIGDGVISLGQLTIETARPGLQRFFIIDACRAPVRRPGLVQRGLDHDDDGSTDSAFSYRNLALRRSAKDGSDSPLVILSACAPKQRAAEISALKRGLFSYVAQDVAEKRVEMGFPLTIDSEFAATVGSRMRAEAHDRKHGYNDVVVQDPVIDGGGGLCLWSPTSKHEHRLAKLLAEFEERLAAGAIDSPPGRCAADTLPRLAVHGLAAANYEDCANRLDEARAQASDQSLLQRALQLNSEAAWVNVSMHARLESTREKARHELIALRVWAQAEAERAKAQLEVERLAEEDRARRDEERRVRDRVAEQARLDVEAAEIRSRQAAAEHAARVAAEAKSSSMDEARREAQKEAARRRRENRAAEAAARTQREAERRERSAAAEARLAREQQRLEELSAWDHAELRRSTADYEEFLRLWPHGAHAQRARVRIAELRKAAEARARAEADERAKAEAARQAQLREEQERETHRRAELSSWNDAELQKSIAAYEELLRLWPRGAHAQQARSRIAELRKAAEAQARAEADERARAETAREAKLRDEQRERQRLAELSAWNHAELQKSMAAYLEFLRLWGRGAHAQQARSRIAELRKAAEAKAQAEADERARAEAAREAKLREEQERERRQDEDRSAWILAETQKSTAAYADYLRLWPRGTYAQQAYARIADLRNAAEAHAQAEIDERARVEAARQAKQSEEQERERQRKAELLAWNQAELHKSAIGSLSELQKTINAYADYLRLWPAGAHAGEARARISRILKSAASARRPDAPSPTGHPEAPSPTGHPEAPGSTGHSEAPGPTGQEEAAVTAELRGAFALARGPLLSLAAAGVLVVGIVILYDLMPRNPEPAPKADAHPPTNVASTLAPPPQPTSVSDVRPSFVRPQEIAAYLTLRSRFLRSNGKSTPGTDSDQGAHFASAEAWLAEAERLARAGVGIAQLDAANARLEGRGLPLDPSAATLHYLNWLADAGRMASADAVLEVQYKISHAMVIGLDARAPRRDWQRVQEAIRSAPAFPGDYWRGLLARCLGGDPGRAQARQLFESFQRAEMPVAASHFLAAAQQQLDNLDQPCTYQPDR